MNANTLYNIPSYTHVSSYVYEESTPGYLSGKLLGVLQEWIPK